MDIIIQDGTLVSASGWGNLIVPEGVNCVGYRACSNTDLGTVTLPDGVTRIGDYAFYGCRFLHRVTIPASVTSIGKFAFGNCPELREISIPPSVTCIAPNAFHCFDLNWELRWDDGPFTIYGKRDSAAEAYAGKWTLCEFKENGAENGRLNIGGLLYSKPHLTPDRDGKIVIFRRTEKGSDPQEYEWSIGADGCPERTIRILPDDPEDASLYDDEDLYHRMTIPPTDLYEAVEAAANIFRWNGFPEWADAYKQLRQDAENLLEERILCPADAVSVEAMREAAREAIARGTSAIELMGRAAQGVFNAYDGWEGKETVVVCGPGNNGGVGYALAEILKTRGHTVRICRLSDKLSDAGRYYFERCSALGVRMWTAEEDGIDFLYTDIYVDCMLGTGFRGKLRDPIASYIREVNEERRINERMFVISVDINSGLNGDTGDSELAVESSLTVSAGFFKKGLFLNRGRKIIGKAVNIDIIRT